MRLCFVGKFPPIAGGVSTRSHALVHALARRGHDVRVITDARDVEPPWRMFMRTEDWQRCEADYGRGRVRVHWTDRFDLRQAHIPSVNPVVTKLASVGIDAARMMGAELVFSFYAEPYAVAGHLIAEACGLPHIVRMAGSDAGRLWRHPQLKPLYDHVFLSAAMIFAGGAVADALEKLGVPRERIRPDRAYRVADDVFSPDGPVLDVDGVLDAAGGDPLFAPLCRGRLRPDLRYFGVYGKLGARKGTASLLHALEALKSRAGGAGLLVMGHALPHADEDYRALASSLGLSDRIVQIPFLPNWRVPEFIRRCLAVCCLEQDFPIAHAPIVARETMTCGACLVASTEILLKLPFSTRVVHGYNAVAVNDVNDIEELAGRLGDIVARPDLASIVGERARRLSLDYQRDIPFPAALEQTLLDAITAGRPARSTIRSGTPRPAGPIGTFAAQRPGPDSLFRLSMNGWALEPERIGGLVPKPANGITIAPAAGAQNADAPSPLIDDGYARARIDMLAASILGLCDGRRTITEIADALAADCGDQQKTKAVVAGVLALFELGALTLSERTDPKGRRKNG